MGHFEWVVHTSLLWTSVFITQGEKKKAPDPREVEVRLTDGSRVRMTILEEHLDVVTKYGKLKIPVGDIRRVEFGIRPSEQVASQIEAAIGLLAGNAFKDREKALKDLVAIGAPAYLALYKASKSTDAEVARRAKAALKGIREKIPESELRVRDDDLIQTAEFTAVGKITSPTIKAQSATFGEAQLKTTELRAIRSMALHAEVEVEVEAAKYAMGNNQWLDTGVELSTDDELAVNASGQVDLMVNGGGQYMTGPAGHPQLRGPGTHPSGALVGRVGDTGEPFLIGEKYTGNAKREGKLYVQISPSPWARNGQASGGSYKVKILGGRDAGER